MSEAVKKVTEITPAEEARVLEWTKSKEYLEKNLAREATVINPAHGCQPVGAQLAAHGFEGSLPFVHGSQGCASYYRSMLNRHFREPAPAVSDAMTEDGAVFGGQNNLFEGLENAYRLYHPKIMPIFTSCMPEIIGDDLTAFIKNARLKGHIPEDFPVPYANTPSFNGTHIHGYDAMLKAILEGLSAGKRVEGACTGKLNLIAGFDACTGNYREYKRLLEAMDVPYTLLADISETFDSPLDGTYHIYPGGTPLEEAAESVNGKATISVQKYATANTMKFIQQEYAGKHEVLPMPIGVQATDAFLLKVAELFGKPVPEALKAERGRVVDAMTDAHQYLHNKKFALYGDPDQLLAMAGFLLEMGARPYHVLCSRATKKFEKEMKALLDSSPYGKGCHVWINKDLWHLRSILFSDPVDMMLGDTHGKFAARDTGTPLIRIGFPIMDRVNIHRYPIIGYQGALNLLTWIANKFLDIKDETCEDQWFEMMR